MHRVADRWLGIPAVRVLGLLRSRAEAPVKPERIGILATAAIGDTLLMSAVLSDLAATHPEAHLTLFAGESNLAVARLACPVHEIQPIGATRPLAAIRRFNSMGPFDAWLDFGPWPRINALLTHFAPAKYKIGFAASGQHRHHVYHAQVEHGRDRHEIENLRALVAPLGVSSRSLPNLKLPRDQAGEPYTVLHMFPGGYRSHFKAWSRDNWIALINALTAEGRSVQLSGAAVDAAEARTVQKACNHRDKVRSRAGELDIAATAALLTGAEQLISVNTGIMHLGAACGTPVVALNGPTSPLRWGPLGDRVINLNASSRSAGCLHLGFEYDPLDPNSLDTITAEQVLAASAALDRADSSA